jgi:hypothetical protein
MKSTKCITNKVTKTLMLLVLYAGLLFDFGLCPPSVFANQLAVVPSSQVSDPLSPYHIYIPSVTQSENTQSVNFTYYVSPQGSDSNPGSSSRPWKTISKAASKVKAGDIVAIRGGIYNEAPRIETSGTPNQPIRFTAYPGEYPILDGNNQLPASDRGLISVFGNWVQLAGLEVRNSKYLGVGLYGVHDTVSKFYVHHSFENGILINGDYGTVEDSRVWRNALSNEYNKLGSWATGLSAARDVVDGITDYAIIRRNIVWENWGEGISSFEANQIIMEDNISHDNFSTNIYISDSTNVVCQRNFVYMDPGSYVYGYGDNLGISMGDETYNPPTANIQILNNIAYGNFANFWWWPGTQGDGMNNVLIANNTFVNGTGNQGGVIISKGNHLNVQFENNLVEQNGSQPVIATVNQAGVLYTHNLWSKTPYSAVSDTGDVIGDPQLAKIGQPYSTDWFRLKTAAPGINKSIPLSEVQVDFFGNNRDNLPDLGASEFIR